MLEALQTPGGYERVLAILKPTPHRVLPVPSLPQLLALAQQENGTAKIHAIFQSREEAIHREFSDPYRYGMVLEPWKDARELLYGTGAHGVTRPTSEGNLNTGRCAASATEGCMLLAVFGGNRASKTEFGANEGVHKLVEKERSNVLWLHESEQTSIDVQQVAVHKYLPMEWREVRKGKVTNVNYTRKNGFSDNKFVLPNGSVGKFGSYKQDISDYEGLEYDLIIADENLPLAWLRTLLVRLATRAGKFVWSFTPIRGITPAGKEITDGAVTVQSRRVDSDLLDPKAIHVADCPAGHMPYIQRSPYGGHGSMIIYFHSELNPYGGYDTLKKILMGFEVEDRKRRGYGYARNTILTLFPTFSASHIIDGSAVPQNVSRYHVADPAGARNMFQIWVAVDAEGRHFVYREWPDVPRFGEWAVPAEDNRKWDGMPGPAQPTLGFGVLEYKRQILADEGNHWDGTNWVMDGETIEQRFMDPRSGAAQAIVENEGGSSLMDRMREDHHDKRDCLEGPSLDFLPAKGLREDEGIQAISDLLSFDRSKPITALVNEPKLFITRNCQNTIWALKNYTGHDGEKAACKDPIDCLRYLATEKLVFLDPKRPVSVGGGSY